MFYQQVKPRAGVAKISSDGEKLFVTKALFKKTQTQKTSIRMSFVLLTIDKKRDLI